MPRREIPLAQRAGLLAIAAGLLVLLAVAAALTPDPRGYGTHEQLGLPPCGAVAVLGVRCPACGMTTAWACLVRGRLLGALRANVAGALLGLVTMLAVPWLVVSAVRGRWLLWRPTSGVAVAVGVGLAAIAMVDWAVRLIAGWD